MPDCRLDCERARGAALAGVRRCGARRGWYRSFTAAGMEPGAARFRVGVSGSGREGFDVHAIHADRHLVHLSFSRSNQPSPADWRIDRVVCHVPRQLAFDDMEGAISIGAAKLSVCAGLLFAGLCLP